MTPFTSEAGSTTSSTPFSTHLEAEQRQLSLANFAIPNTEFQSVKAEEPSRVSSERAPLTEQPSVQMAYRSLTSRSTAEYRRQTTAIDCIRVYQAGTPIETGGSSMENSHFPPVECCSESIVSDDKVPPNMMTTHLHATNFFENALRPTVKPQVPMTRLKEFTSTLQLVYCITLLLNSSESALHGESVQKPVDLTEDTWLRRAKEDPEIQKDLCSLTSTMVKVFVDARSQCSDLIAEIVLLGPVLNRTDYHTLLSYVIDTLNLSYWQNIEYLRGMIQLVQSAPPGVLADGHVDKILTAIRKHLQKTMENVHHLVSAVMKVLEVMARGIVEDLDRQRDYQPLLDVLHAKSDKDESLKFQVQCAVQACLYLSADETPLRNVRCSALLATDVDVVITELDRAHAGRIAGSTETDTDKEAGQIAQKEAWYPALQAAETFVQHGRLVEFGQLVRSVSCCYDLNFRRGVCQIIGKIAIDPLWTVANRQGAIDCLGELYRLHEADVDFGTDHNIRSSIVAILHHISSIEESDIKKHADTLLSDLLGRKSCNLQIFHPWMTRLPLPPTYSLLCSAQAILQEESRLKNLRRTRLQEYLQPIYITPQAITSRESSRDKLCSLSTTMQEFLKSDRLVYLLLGESGSGKTLSCRHLERELWYDYRNGGVIPIYIDLSCIDNPKHNLIETQLHLYDFSTDEIQQLLQHRRFVIICDGYDVRRLTTNLYNTNQLGRRDVKMIISCRSTFLPSDYQGRFRPHGPSHYCGKSAELYEQSTIAPLSESDIKKFIQQYVQDLSVQEPLGKLRLSNADDYWNALASISNMLDVVKNPFLLTLALKYLRSLPHNALDPARRVTTRDQLYNSFINSWIDANKTRLDSTILNQEYSDAYVLLCEPNFRWCVRDFLKRLATAMWYHQRPCPVVTYIERKDKGTWKAEFLGRAIEATLLREAAPLTKTRILHRFLYDSLFVFFRFLAAYKGEVDSNDSDDDDDDDDDDSFDGQDGFHGDGGAFFHGDVNALTDGNAGSSGGSGGSGGSSDNSNRSTGGSDRSSGGNDSSTGGNDDSTSGRGNFGDGRGVTGNGGSSGGGKDASEGDKDGPRRPKDVSRSKKKSRSNKPFLPTFSDLFSNENYLNDLDVLELLVERARADLSMRTSLFMVIEKSKLSTAPSLAAANSITILFKAGERFHNIDMSNVWIPSDYILKEAKEFIEADLMAMLSGFIIPTDAPVPSSSFSPEREYTTFLTTMPSPPPTSPTTMPSQPPTSPTTMQSPPSTFTTTMSSPPPTMPSPPPTSRTTMPSPPAPALIRFFDDVELVSLLCSFLTTKQVFMLVQTNKLLRKVAGPFLWRDVDLDADHRVEMLYTHYDPIYHVKYNDEYGGRILLSKVAFYINTYETRSLKAGFAFMSYYLEGVRQYLDNDSTQQKASSWIQPHQTDLVSNPLPLIKKLRRLDVSLLQVQRYPNTFFIGLNDAPPLAPRLFQFITLNAAYLTSVSLRDFQVSIADQNNTQLLCSTISNLPNLAHLAIDISVKPSEPPFSIIPTVFFSCPISLVSFSMTTTVRGDVEEGSWQGKSLTGLKYLKLPQHRTGYKLAQLNLILSQCPALEEWADVPSILVPAELGGCLQYPPTILDLSTHPSSNSKGETVAGIMMTIPKDQLKSLDFCLFEDTSPDKPDLPAPFILSLLRHSASLVTISLVDIKWIQSKSVMHILTTCTALTSLVFASSNTMRSYLTVEDAIAEPWKCTRLRELRLIINLNRGCPNEYTMLDKLYTQIGDLVDLEILDLMSACRIKIASKPYTETTMTRMLALRNETTNHEGFLQSLVKLKNLRVLLGSFILSNQEMKAVVGEAEVEWILEHWPRLETIEFVSEQERFGSAPWPPQMELLKLERPNLQFCRTQTR